MGCSPRPWSRASVADYFRALASVGYDDWVTVEDFSAELPLTGRSGGADGAVKRLNRHALNLPSAPIRIVHLTGRPAARMSRGVSPGVSSPG